MVFWFTPFPLASSLEAKLHAAGLRQHTGSPAGLPDRCLLVYASPHEALEALRSRDPIAPTPEQLLDRYQSLLQLAPSRHLISCRRLHQLSAQQIACWTTDQAHSSSRSHPPDLSALASLGNQVWPTAAPLGALVSSTVLQRCPACTDAYCRLEQMSERFGSPPDLDYGARLLAAVDVEGLLDQWWQSQPESDLTLLQLQQVEEELLTLFLAHRQQLTTQHQLRSQLHDLMGVVQRQHLMLSRALQP